MALSERPIAQPLPRPTAARCFAVSRPIFAPILPTPGFRSLRPPWHSASRRVISATCCRMRRPRPSALCSPSGWPVANAISPPRVSPIDRSAKLRLHGALMICRPSDECFANTMACRPRMAAQQAVALVHAGSIKNRQIAPLKQGTRMSALGGNLQRLLDNAIGARALV